MNDCNHRHLLPLLLVAVTIFLSCQSSKPGSPEHINNATAAIDDKALLDADKNPGDWLSYGRNYSEDRYSTLDQVSNETVNRLGLAWSLDLGFKRGFEATPVVVDGVMYVSGTWVKCLQ